MKYCSQEMHPPHRKVDSSRQQRSDVNKARNTNFLEVSIF